VVDGTHVRLKGVDAAERGTERGTPCRLDGYDLVVVEKPCIVLAAIHDGISFVPGHIRSPAKIEVYTFTAYRTDDTGGSRVRYAHCDGKPRKILKASVMRVERMDHHDRYFGMVTACFVDRGCCAMQELISQRLTVGYVNA
jgi:hypothetical protein